MLNRVRYINRCVESILSQEYENYEVLIVDNGSTDGTLEYVESISKSFDNFYSLKESVKGVAAARNKGILEAKGRYIHILDSDNYFLSSKSLLNLNTLINRSPKEVNVWLTSNLNEVNKNISYSIVLDTIVTPKDYLLTSGEFSITANSSWFKINLHPVLEDVTHEILFPAIYNATTKGYVFLSSEIIQRYTTEAPDRLSAARLSNQQILNYQSYYFYSFKKVGVLLPLNMIILIVFKFLCYDRLSSKRIKVNNVLIKVFQFLFKLIPRDKLKRVVEKKRNT